MIQAPGRLPLLTASAPLSRPASAAGEEKVALSQDEAVDEAAVDMATLDSAREVLQLPIMDPAVQLTIALGGVAMVLASMGGGNASLAIQVATQSGGHLMTGSYGQNLENGSPMDGQGSVNGVPLVEDITLDESGVHYRGQYGENQMRVDYVTTEDETLIISGEMGGVETNIQMMPVFDAEDNVMGLHSMGLIDGKMFTQDTLFRAADGRPLNLASVAEGGQFEGKIWVRGHLDGEPIRKDYEVDLDLQESQIQAFVSGGGMNAGMPQAVSAQLQFKVEKDGGE